MCRPPSSCHPGCSGWRTLRRPSIEASRPSISNRPDGVSRCLWLSSEAWMVPVAPWEYRIGCVGQVFRARSSRSAGPAYANNSTTRGARASPTGNGSMMYLPWWNAAPPPSSAPGAVPSPGSSSGDGNQFNSTRALATCPSRLFSTARRARAIPRGYRAPHWEWNFTPALTDCVRHGCGVGNARGHRALGEDVSAGLGRGDGRLGAYRRSRQQHHRLDLLVSEGGLRGRGRRGCPQWPPTQPERPFAAPGRGSRRRATRPARSRAACDAAWYALDLPGTAMLRALRLRVGNGDDAGATAGTARRRCRCTGGRWIRSRRRQRRFGRRSCQPLLGRRDPAPRTDATRPRRTGR